MFKNILYEWTIYTHWRWDGILIEELKQFYARLDLQLLFEVFSKKFMARITQLLH